MRTAGSPRFLDADLNGGRVMRCQHVDDDIQCRMDATRRVLIVGGDPPDPDQAGFAGTVYLVQVCMEHDPDPGGRCRCRALPDPYRSASVRGGRDRRHAQTSTTIQPKASVRLVTWWRGVFAEGHPPGLEIRVAQEPVDEPGRSADAGPVVIPQRRHQPGAVGGEHQVGQRTLPERPVAALTPGGSLSGPASTTTSAIRNTRSPLVHRGRRGHRHRYRDTQATTAGLPTARSAARARHGLARPALHRRTAARPFVGLEDRRDGGGNGQARGRAVGDPRDLCVCSDAPLPAVFGPPPAWILLSLGGRPGEGRRHRPDIRSPLARSGEVPAGRPGVRTYRDDGRQPWRARVFGNAPGQARR